MSTSPQSTLGGTIRGRARKDKRESRGAAAPKRRRLDFAPERLERLLAVVRARRAARLAELCAALSASPATVRRDLARLERAGRLRRVHGGAVSVESRLEEPPFDDKTGRQAAEKRRIAEAAAALIRPGETIYLDGGSTALELARRLRERTDVTIVTNSLRAAMELAGRGPRTILIGGELRRRSETCVGALSRPALERLHFDRAFMGTIGLSAEGLTTTDPAEAFTKELALERAREAYLLADHSKAGVVSFVRSGTWEDLDGWITDRPPGAAWRKRLKTAGVRIIVAGEGDR